MKKSKLFMSIVPLLFGSYVEVAVAAANHEELAIEFLNGVYGGDPTVVDRLASPDIVVSYPIFEELFAAPSIRGRDAVRDFAAGFGERWIDAEVTVYSVVSSDDMVVLLWGFRARRANGEGDNAGVLPESAWGGISLYRFDDNDRVVLEIGEESNPGPAARVPAAFVKP